MSAERVSRPDDDLEPVEQVPNSTIVTLTQAAVVTASYAAF